VLARFQLQIASVVYHDNFWQFEGHDSASIAITFD
jgi:hypothetical protein